MSVRKSNVNRVYSKKLKIDKIFSFFFIAKCICICNSYTTFYPTKLSVALFMLMKSNLLESLDHCP